MEEKYIYYNNLFDIYEKLLTDKEIETFKDYYQEDLSLSEIADNKNISKSAVGKMIKTILDKLDNLEEKLKIYSTREKLEEIAKIDDIKIIKERINEIISS